MSENVLVEIEMKSLGGRPDRVAGFVLGCGCIISPIERMVDKRSCEVGHGKVMGDE